MLHKVRPFLCLPWALSPRAGRENHVLAGSKAMTIASHRQVIDKTVVTTGMGNFTELSEATLDGG